MMSSKVWGITVVVLIIVASALGSYWYFYLQEDEKEGVRVTADDIIEINYIGRLTNEDIFDTNIEYVADDDVKYRKNSAIFEPKDTYEPLGFKVSSGAPMMDRRIPLEEYLVGKRMGEWVNIDALAPWQAYGNWSWDDVENTSRIENVSRWENITTNEFTRNSNEPLTEGVYFKHWVWGWNCTIVLIDDEIVTIKHLPECNDDPVQPPTYEIPINATKYAWDSTVIYTDINVIKVRHEPELDMSVKSGARTGKILSMTDDIISVDYNHKLAGKTVSFEIEIVSIEQGV